MALAGSWGMGSDLASGQNLIVAMNPGGAD